MDRKLKGRIAEAKVLPHFVERGYDVYLPMQECTAVDLVVIKDGVVSRVSVKYTSIKENQKWRVSLTNTSRKRDGTTDCRTFNRDAVDLLAVYIGPEDRVVVRDADFDAKYAIAVN